MTSKSHAWGRRSISFASTRSTRLDRLPAHRRLAHAQQVGHLRNDVAVAPRAHAGQQDLQSMPVRPIVPAVASPGRPAPRDIDALALAFRPPPQDRATGNLPLREVHLLAVVIRIRRSLALRPRLASLGRARQGLGAPCRGPPRSSPVPTDIDHHVDRHLRAFHELDYRLQDRHLSLQELPDRPLVMKPSLPRKLASAWS